MEPASLTKNPSGVTSQFLVCFGEYLFCREMHLALDILLISQKPSDSISANIDLKYLPRGHRQRIH